MAVKGLDIFKLSPKKNCKECGSPTCMAFCMKVAQGAVEITKCPYMSAEAVALLSEATAPPMKTITVGEHKLGGETVMMRHEKTLVNRNLFAATLCTCMDDAKVEERIEGIKKVDYERIGEREMVECVFVHDAGDSAKFVELCKKAAAIGDRTVIIDTKDVDTAKAAVEAIKDNKPILNGANEAAVAQFLAGKIRFLEIADKVQRAMETVPVIQNPSLTQVLEADAAAREAAR